MKILYFVIPITLLGIILLYLPQDSDTNPGNNYVSPTPSAVTDSTPILVDFTAGFEIYTLGAKRVFTDKKYHNQSTDVYISSFEPSTIYVKKDGIKWSDFFATLPMKLTKDCLTTGTGQVFCTNETRKLRFYVNGIEDPDALDSEIRDGDNLKVEFI